jgi:transcriptional regulator of heat shock response
MTDRQRQILLSLISEYLTTAAEVGSSTLVNHYDLHVSPATVRNEMSLLTKKGYLAKSHSSAGRQPTALAFRKFVEELLEETELDHIATVRAKQQIMHHRHNRERVIREAVQELVALTKMTAIAVTDNAMYYGGISNLLSQPEFHESEVLQRIVNVIEDHSMLSKVFAIESPRNVKVIIGPEIGLDALRGCSVVYKNFNFYGDQKGVVAVVGPTRMDYAGIIPAVRFVSDVLSSSVAGW